MRGHLDYALGFEGLFRLPGDRAPLLRVRRVETTKGTITSLIAGHGPEHVVCLHGLGSNKASFFETVAALAPDHTVHAIDLPGFGSSDKPARGRYNAPWFANAVISYLDAREIDRAHLIGNSMGGRIALEVGFDNPERVSSLSLLAPALAFRRRQLAPLIRMLRPELAVFPHACASRWSALSSEPSSPTTSGSTRRPPTSRSRSSCACTSSRAARVAFFAAARNIYLDEPHGEDGFYARLAKLVPPALFIWGDRDTADPRQVLAPRREGAAERRPGDPHRLRPRASGGARRPHQPAHPRPDRLRTRARAEAPQRGVLKRLRRTG